MSPQHDLPVMMTVQITDTFKMSARTCADPDGSDRVLKLARTIADRVGSERIETVHLAEAIQYRPRRQA